MSFLARPRLFQFTGLGLLAGALALSARAAEEPSAFSRLFTASDLPRLREGLALPRDGQYTVKVWAPARQHWTLKADGQGLELSAQPEGNDETPGWRIAGTAPLKGGAPFKLTIPALEQKRAKEEAQKKKEERNREKLAPVAVPALIVVSSDPNLDPSPALDLVRGRVDAVSAPDDPRRTQARTNQKGASFQPPATPQAWRDRAQHVREQLLVTLGLWPMLPRTPIHARVSDKVERDGYTIEKVALETLPGFYLGGNLYRPIGKAGKRPGILSPHGHYAEGRMHPDVQARCIGWAKLGAVIFMYDMVGYNDTNSFGHSFLDDRLRRWGLSLPTLQTWNSIRAIDWMATLPDVDAERIGCTGESGGGTQTFLVTAVDDRIKVAAPVVMVSDQFQGGCLCENAAGLRFGTDNVEFAALTAPRPLKLVGATGDWTARTMSKAYPTIRSIFELVGTPERVDANVFDFNHNYNQTSRNAVYAFMGKWLLGIDDSGSTKEGPQKVEKKEDLRVFNDKDPAPCDRKKSEQLEAYLIEALGKQIDALAPGESPSAWEAARALLLTSLKIRVGLENPGPADLNQTEVRRLVRDGVTIVHSVVGRKATGEHVPVVRLIPKNATGRLTVIASRRGKAALMTAEGLRLNTLVRALLDRGQSVIGYSPLLGGESADPADYRPELPNVYVSDTYNPVLAAHQLQDLATVLSWARAQPDALEVSLVALGMAGPQVLLARPALVGLARTAIDLHDFDPGDGSGPLPASFDLPGLFQFGGLKAAAALTAPAPLWIYRAGAKFAKAWPERAYELSGVSHQLRLGSESVQPEDLARWVDSGE